MTDRIMTDAEREEARRIIAVQASTLPEPTIDPDTHLKVRNIGPRGAWERARGVLTRPGCATTGHLEDVALTQETAGMGSREPRRPGARVLR